MANIGATTAFYKVETSLTRANNEVSKSMERLATGKANANAGDRSSYVAMADTFRLDFVGTKAGIKGASVAMGYLETGMRVLDSASALLSRLQELAVLGANDTNTTADHEAINLEAEAIADEFNRLMTTSTYKGKDAFVEVASSQYVSMGGLDQEMTFGIGKLDYSQLFNATGRTIVEATNGNSDGPNVGKVFNLAHLPSDAVVAKEYGRAAATGLDNSSALEADQTYIVTTLPAAGQENYDGDDGATPPVADEVASMMRADTSAIFEFNDSDGTAKAATTDMALGDVLLANAEIATADMDATIELKQVNAGDNAFKAGDEFEIVSMGTSNGEVTAAGLNDASALGRASSDIADGEKLVVGKKFTIDADASVAELAHINALTSGMTFRRSSDTLTKDIEAVQGLINTARVQAGSQYAAMESAVNYTTDLTAQYELGYNTVSDVNFSMETAHLAKNQILQQAATAMLAQANQGQQSLLQLIQG
jgi:flagellin